MTRAEIIKELKKFFDIRELVCPHCYAEHGERSWQFLATELLHTLLVLRVDVFKTSMTVNNYHYAKTTPIYDERGLRCNLCSLVIAKTKKKICYLSAHVNAAGIDFDVKGLTAEQARKIIKANKHLLPYPVRLEKFVSWVHLDIYDYCNDETVNEFAG